MFLYFLISHQNRNQILGRQKAQQPQPQPVVNNKTKTSSSAKKNLFEDHQEQVPCFAILLIVLFINQV